jgi:hypothetical protein
MSTIEDDLNGTVSDCYGDFLLRLFSLQLPSRLLSVHIINYLYRPVRWDDYQPPSEL